MENRRALLIATVCFLIAIGLIWSYVTVKRKEMTAEYGDEVGVVVATKYIKEYATIMPEMVTVIPMFKNYKQPRTVSKMIDVIGKATYVPIEEGEQITLTKLIEQDGKPVLGRQVEKNQRAVTLLISPYTGVGKLIRPGNRVDVLAAPIFEAKGQTVTEVTTVVQNALVLATGKRVQNEVPSRVSKRVLNFLQGDFEKKRRQDFYSGGLPGNTIRPADDSYSSITLQVSPQQAEKLVFLTSSFGDRNLYFTLRNGADQAIGKVATTLLDDILGPESDYAKSKRKPPPRKIRPPKWIDNVGGSQIPVKE